MMIGAHLYPDSARGCLILGSAMVAVALIGLLYVNGVWRGPDRDAVARSWSSLAADLDREMQRFGRQQPRTPIEQPDMSAEQRMVEWERESFETARLYHDDLRRLSERFRKPLNTAARQMKRLGIESPPTQNGDIQLTHALALSEWQKHLEREASNLGGH